MSGFVDIDNARLDVQRKVMQDIDVAGHCPFCIENLEKYHTEPIIKKGTYWLVTKNQWPYEHTKVHYLLINLTHVEHISQLDSAAGVELIELAQWLSKEFGVVGGGLVMRFGDTNYSAGSVSHLHAQFIQPDIEQPGFKPVRVKLGKSPR